MENLGFNLMASVIIAVSATMLIIGSGAKIYEDAASSIISAENSMSMQEKDAFNNQFTAYEGTQTGSNVKALIGVLIANSNTYKDETEKIPSFIIKDKVEKNGIDLDDAVAEEDINNYITNLTKIRQELENKHTYTLEMHFNTDGYIDEIRLYYEY